MTEIYNYSSIHITHDLLQFFSLHEHNSSHVKLGEKNEKSKRVTCDMIKTVPVPFLQFSYAIKSCFKNKAK